LVSGWSTQIAGDVRNAYKVVVGNPERKRPLGSRSRRWEDNIRMDPRIMGSEVVDRMHLTEDRDQWWTVVNTVMNHRVL